jgi:hypothetical protein
MKPRRTPNSNKVFRLPGGNEDSDLWVEQGPVLGSTALKSTWELDDEERKAIAQGANIELVVWGFGTPPVSLAVTFTELGKGTTDE